MKKAEILNVLESIQGKISNLEDQGREEIVSVLLNLVENLNSENSKLREENQALKDEINILKGEQGKANIKPNRNKDGNISSEQERVEAERAEANGTEEGFKLDRPSLEKLKEDRIPVKVLKQLEDLRGETYSNKDKFILAVKSVIGEVLTNQYIELLAKHARYKKRNRKPKLPLIEIDREVVCAVDTTQLPQDVRFKGYKNKVVQDMIIKTDNVRFKREFYYSESEKKTYLGEIPIGYEGDYGPGINSYIVSMKYVNNMSIPKIHEFLENVGTFVSSSYISNRLTNHMDIFHREKSELYQASLENSSYQQIDDTTSRVNGENYYTQIVCNPLATVFFTTKRKDRLTILDVLRNFESHHFIFNEETFRLLDQLKVSRKIITLLNTIEKNKPFDESQIHEILQKYFPDPDKGQLSRTRILEASAIAYYHQEVGVAVVKVLLCDDAPQFKLLTDELSLCWVHDNRHYKRLNPIVPAHKKRLMSFCNRYWGYYHKLHGYKKNPSSESANSLTDEFDTLFSTKTGYDELDARIAKSKNKANELLTVLKHPEIPLHNNLSENGARVQKRREDVSLHTITDAGTEAKDTMMSIVETCKKHGLSSYQYIYDRVSKNIKMPSLASLIKAKTVARQ